MQSATACAPAPLPSVGCNVRHFLDLARRGQWGGSSSGEKAAAKLYAAVIDCVPTLDCNALDGLLDWIAIAGMNPQTAASMIDPGQI